MLQHILQNHPRIQPDLLVVVSFERSEDDIVVRAEVLDRREPRTDLPSEELREHLHDVFARFEFESVQVVDEVEEEVGGVGFLCELGDEFGYRVCVEVEVTEKAGEGGKVIACVCV